MCLCVCVHSYLPNGRLRNCPDLPMRGMRMWRPEVLPIGSVCTGPALPRWCTFLLSRDSSLGTRASSECASVLDSSTTGESGLGSHCSLGSSLRAPLLAAWLHGHVNGGGPVWRAHVAPGSAPYRQCVHWPGSTPLVHLPPLKRFISWDEGKLGVCQRAGQLYHGGVGLGLTLLIG